MIIFDLDTLADCDHRRHFVDLDKYRHAGQIMEFEYSDGRKWQPDWKSFNDACDKDKIIFPVAFQFHSLKEKFGINHPIQIWSGRCESVKEKTIDWLQINFTRDINWRDQLKMRPIGDNTPDDELKEKWLDEELSKGKKIEFVFESDPKSIEMWKSRGVFVFDCNQSGGEF